MENKIIQSYVYYHGGDLHDCYFVSTINRFASFDSLSKYSETMVWQCDNKTLKRYNKILFQSESSVDSLTEHFKICQELSERGCI